MVLWFNGSAADKKNPQSNSQGGPPAKSVVAQRVNLQSIEMTTKIPGRVLAYRTAEIRPQVSGIILKRLFKEGGYIEKGEQLYQIDPERYEADYQMAEANVQTAEAELARAQALEERYTRLIESKAISEQELDDAKAAMAQAKASLARAKAEERRAQINLNYTKVYAPISGFIGPSTVTEGALVSERQTEALAVMRQLDPVYVDLSQPGSESQELKKELIEARGSDNLKKRYEVSLFLRDLNKVYEHKGYIDATEQAVDEETGSIRLRSVFPNPDITLLPGMFVQASVASIGDRRVMLVPHKAVTIQASGEKTVWVVKEDDTVEQRSLETKQSIENQWLILDGLKEGELIVIEGIMHLAPGDKVSVETSEHNQSESHS